MVSAAPIKTYVLPNGLTVVHQENRVSRAFCVGAWTRTGARDERTGEEGLCHFLEHMLFKGTPTRSALAISQEIERIGGSLDAFTTKDTMCVYAQVIESRRDIAFELVGDMLRHSMFADEHVALEREVVLEEIGDVMDAPDDLIHELFASAVFPRHPLGRPILGVPKSVSSFARADLLRFWRRVFRAPNVVLSVYGNIPAGELKSACRRLFAFPEGEVRRPPARLAKGRPSRRTVLRNLHQQHVCIGSRTFSYHEEDRFALLVLATLLGGGMSSRLFQRIREEKGLTYTIYTYADHSWDTGMMATYMAVRPANVGRTVREVLREFDRVRGGDVGTRELDDTKEQIKGRILLGLETSSARMMRNARNELQYRRQATERELVRRVDGVSLDDVNRVARAALDRDRLHAVSLGPSTGGMSSF
jgi:predicted Zn-dependent peptidase